MAYPWYSTGKGTAGKNRLFNIIVESNYETDEIRYRANIIDHSTKTGKKSFTSKDLEQLESKVQRHINKMTEIKNEQLDDVKEVFIIRGKLTKQ